jgi:hypothetical protein
MNYIIEAIFVGVYTCLIYLIFSSFIKNFYITLLVVGFLKHLLGHFLGIHTLYCNNGEACIKVLNQNDKYISKGYNLIILSVDESILFLILGLIFKPFFPINKLYLYFAIGAVLHILSENFLIHNIFCKHNCDKKQTNNKNYNEVKNIG